MNQVKKSTILVIALLAMFNLIYSCSKDLTNESPVKESQTAQPSQKQPSANALLSEENDERDPETGMILYPYFKEQILEDGYTEITIPATYIPHINVSNYPGAVLHLFISANQSSYFEAYTFPTPTEAKEAAAAEGCDHKSYATKDGESCEDSGNECKFDTTTGIVCCGQ